MLIETTRFGPVDVDADKLITFSEGILGFPGRQRYALIQTGPDPVFFWLQNVADPALAFVVCDPLAFEPDYSVPVRPDDVRVLELDDLSDCQVLVIVNRIDGYLTGNLMGPLLIGARSRQAKQLVLSDKRYGTRHRLLPVQTPAALAKTA
jgi:flagellar assembly factor FliW